MLFSDTYSFCTFRDSFVLSVQIDSNTSVISGELQSEFHKLCLKININTLIGNWKYQATWKSSGLKSTQV